MNRRAAVCMVALYSACASAPRTRVLVEYTRPVPIEHVAVEALNATGHPLPLPPASIVEQAVRAVSKQPEPDSTVADAFARALTARVAFLNVRPAAADAPRLRISLTAWDVHGGDAAGAVVFVSADYQLLGEHGEVWWHVRQDRLPVRLGGPNLSRDEVARVAGRCVEQALTSWAGRGAADAP